MVAYPQTEPGMMWLSQRADLELMRAKSPGICMWRGEMSSRFLTSSHFICRHGILWGQFVSSRDTSRKVHSNCQVCCLINSEVTHEFAVHRDGAPKILPWL